MPRPDAIARLSSPIAERSTARDPLWPLVLIVADIAERVERSTVAEFTATASSGKSVETEHEDAAA